MSTTTNVQLAKMMSGHPLFHGVFTRDELPAILKTGSYVCNLDSSHGHIDQNGKLIHGSHWVGIYAFPDHTMMYFDSYGFSAPQNLISRWRKEFNTLYYNTSIQQKFNTCNCGQLTVAFLKVAERGLVAISKWIQSHELLSYT